MNILLNADSYKYTMHKQYPPKTEYVYSYIESRGGVYDKTVLFGLQPFLKELAKPITIDQVNSTKQLIDAHLGEGIFNYDGWKYIVDELDGKLPVVIQSLPEGSLVNNKNVLLTIANTDPKCYWLTTFLETALLRAIWYPTTVATRSHYIKKKILDYLNVNGTPSDIDYKMIDFGSRGVSSLESSQIGGAAHLVNFKGTDNVSALDWVYHNYNEFCVGHSVPASEHSVACSWDKEITGFDNMLTQYKDSPVISYVSDTYDIFNICHEIGIHLKETIIEQNQVFVIRPDSGEPVDVILKCVDILKQYFGTELNDRGYEYFKHIKFLWGDGITLENIESILWNLHTNGYSSDIMVFGAGGYLLQQLDRDTCKFAMKASAICIDGKWKDIFKDPITDPGKKSKTGTFSVIRNQSQLDKYSTIKQDLLFANGFDLLEKVFYDGDVLKEYTFSEVRDNLKNDIFSEQI
jgi:nicotinamide phosphoribosyltransferase